MAIFAAQYFYEGDPGKMAEIRPTHVDFLASLHEEGLLRVSGPTDGGSSALLIFDAESKEDLAARLDEDPFYIAGFIVDRPIRPWKISFGGIS